MPQASNYSVTIGRGSGIGFRSAVPSTSGYMLQSNGAASDPTFEGFLQAGTGATTRTWQAKAREAVSITDFGASPSETAANNATYIQAALTYAVANGKALHIPAGSYQCNAQLTSSGADVAIFGDSHATSRIIFTAATGGFAFTLDAQGVSTPPDQLDLKSFTVETRATVSSPAISATWSAYQANAQGMSWISDIQITRQDDGTGSFTNGIKLTNCFGAFINDCKILGDDLRASAVGINLVDCVEVNVVNTAVNRYALGAQSAAAVGGGPEGIHFHNCYLYDCNSGLSGTGGLDCSFSGGHINCNGASAQYGITLSSVQQATITDSLIYIGGDGSGAATQDGVRLTGCTNIGIQGNIFVGLHADARYGVICSDTTTSCRINNNTFAMLAGSTGIRFAAVGDTDNQAVGNIFQGSLTAFADAGTLNFITNNSNGGTPISNVRWGDSAGGFVTGTVTADANWGGYFKGYSATVADLAFADSAGNNVIKIKSGVAKFLNSGLSIEDTNASHLLNIKPGSNITADRVFTLTTGDADRTLSMSGNITVAADFITSGANSLTLTTTGATDVTLPTTGTLATLSGSETLENKTLTTPNIGAATGTSATVTGTLHAYSGTAVPAGGTTGSGIKVSSTSNLGIFFGSGAPTLSAAQGSLYIRTDGSSTSTRAYVNTNGTTGWTAITTAA